MLVDFQLNHIHMVCTVYNKRKSYDSRYSTFPYLDFITGERCVMYTGSFQAIHVSDAVGDLFVVLLPAVSAGRTGVSLSRVLSRPESDRLLYGHPGVFQEQGERSPGLVSQTVVGLEFQKHVLHTQGKEHALLLQVCPREEPLSPGYVLAQLPFDRHQKRPHTFVRASDVDDTSVRHLLDGTAQESFETFFEELTPKTAVHKRGPSLQLNGSFADEL